MMQEDFKRHIKLQVKRRDGALKQLTVGVARRPEDFEKIMLTIEDSEKRINSYLKGMWVFENYPITL